MNRNGISNFESIRDTEDICQIVRARVTICILQGAFIRKNVLLFMIESWT